MRAGAPGVKASNTRKGLCDLRGICCQGIYQISSLIRSLPHLGQGSFPALILHSGHSTIGLAGLARLILSFIFPQFGQRISSSELRVLHLGHSTVSGSGLIGNGAPKQTSPARHAMAMIRAATARSMTAFPWDGGARSGYMLTRRPKRSPPGTDEAAATLYTKLGPTLAAW
jgi:hypothetical protein